MYRGERDQVQDLSSTENIHESLCHRRGGRDVVNVFVRLPAFRVGAQTVAPPTSLSLQVRPGFSIDRPRRGEQITPSQTCTHPRDSERLSGLGPRPHVVGCSVTRVESGVATEVVSYHTRSRDMVAPQPPRTSEEFPAR